MNPEEEQRQAAEREKQQLVQAMVECFSRAPRTPEEIREQVSRAAQRELELINMKDQARAEAQARYDARMAAAHEAAAAAIKGRHFETPEQRQLEYARVFNEVSGLEEDYQRFEAWKREACRRSFGTEMPSSAIPPAEPPRPIQQNPGVVKAVAAPGWPGPAQWRQIKQMADALALHEVLRQRERRRKLQLRRKSALVAEPVSVAGQIVEAWVNTTGVKDAQGDIVAPGCWQDVLSRIRSGIDPWPAVCDSHDWNVSNVIGRVVAAEELMPQDPRLPQKVRQLGGGALWVRVEFANTEVGRRAQEAINFLGGNLEWSVGFFADETSITWASGVRTINKVAEWIEVSVVLRGASPGTGMAA